MTLQHSLKANVIESERIHDLNVDQLQQQMKMILEQRKSQVKPSYIAPHYRSKESFTMRTKSYKKDCFVLDAGSLKHITKIDSREQVAYVEPNVTMEELIRAALEYGLTVPVVPELKGITVGGAVMGMAGESGSHRWGCFNDSCIAF